MADMTQLRMKAAEFLELPESSQIIELMDAEIIMSPAPLDIHQKISLLRIIPNGELRYAPTDVNFDEVHVFQPDIFLGKR